MNSVYFPAHVAILLRRIANVLGGLSISNQYMILKKSRAEDSIEISERTIAPRTTKALQKLSHWAALKGLHGMAWPQWESTSTWEWPGVHNLQRNDRDTSGSRQLQSSSISFPWLSGRWPLPNLLPLSFGTQPTVDSKDGSPQPAQSPGSPRPHLSPQSQPPEPEQPPDIIHELIANPALYDPLRAPRFPIVLCHGLYGFDVRGPASFPSLRKHYWSNVLSVLRDKVGAEVIVTTVPGTGSIVSRAETLDKQLQSKAQGRGINLLAHSMGGLDCRHLITHIKPTEYAPLSLTTISTPHRGSPFMDWCVDNIGIGQLRKAEREFKKSVTQGRAHSDDTGPWPSYSNTQIHAPEENSSTSAKKDTSSKTPLLSLSLASLPSSFTTLLLSVVDSPAYANLTTSYLNDVFNPSTPDDPRVRYFSVASRLQSVGVWHPFWLPKIVLNGAEKRERERLRTLWERGEPEGGGDGLDAEPLWARDREWGNDGLVTIQSAKWGEFLGIMEGCDHWEMRGARGLEIELPAIGASASDWGIKDWGQFVGAWRREEKLFKDAVKDASSAQSFDTAAASSSGSTSPTQHSTSYDAKEERDRRGQRAQEEEDDIVKSSTDKLSAVFDWLIEQVPSPSLSILGVRQTKESRSQSSDEKARVVKEASAAAEVMKEFEVQRKRTTARKRNELETKEDLERFYVALSRKLYNEGL